MKCLAQGHMGSSLRPDSQAGTPVSPALHDQAVGEPFLSMSTYSVPSPVLKPWGCRGMRSLHPGVHLALGEPH